MTPRGGPRSPSSFQMSAQSRHSRPRGQTPTSASLSPLISSYTPFPAKQHPPGQPLADLPPSSPAPPVSAARIPPSRSSQRYPPPTTAALSPPPGRPGLLRVQPGGGQQGARGSATVTGMPKGRTGSHSASMGQAPACQKAPEAECHRAKRRPCLCPHSLRQLRGDGPRLRASVSSLTSTRTAGLP